MPVPICVWSAIDEDQFHDNDHRLDSPLVCNDDCFHELLTNLSRSELTRDTRAAQCSLLHDVSLSFMYAALCRNILIDSHAHRELQQTPAA